MNAVFAEDIALSNRWFGVCWRGISVAGEKSLQYVHSRGCKLFVAGEGGSKAVSQKESYPRSGGRHGDHRCGVDHRTVVQPKIPGLGLPPDAAEFSRPGVCSLFSFVDPY